MLGSLTKGTVRGYQHDLPRGIGNKTYERIVAAGRGMDDGDTFARPLFDSPASRAFKHHGYRLDELARSYSRTNPLHEVTGRSRSIPPPAGGTGPHHIRRVDENHRRSLLPVISCHDKAPYAADPVVR